MRVAYADPPYLGCCGRYQHDHGIARSPIFNGDLFGLCWDDVNTHRLLIDHLCACFPDGWLMSLSSPSLREILPLCPTDARVGAWVKPFGIYKPNVNPAYVWEPVVWRGGRERTRQEPTVRDWCSVSITLERGLTGAKPEDFCFWMFDLIGMREGDDMVDLFPGSGAVANAWAKWPQQMIFTL